MSSRTRQRDQRSVPRAPASSGLMSGARAALVSNQQAVSPARATAGRPSRRDERLITVPSLNPESDCDQSHASVDFLPNLSEFMHVWVK